MAGDLDHPPRQQGPSDPVRGQGGRPSGLVGLDRLDHDGAVLRLPPRPGPGVGQAPRVAGPARDRVPAGQARSVLSDHATRVRRPAELPEPAQGSGPGRLLHRLGRDRRHRPDLERARPPLRGRPLRGSARRPPGVAAGRRRARRGRLLGGSGRPGGVGPGRGPVDRRPQPAVPGPSGARHRGRTAGRHVRGRRLARDHGQVRPAADRAVRPRRRRGSAPADRRDEQRGVSADAARVPGRAARAPAGRARRRGLEAPDRRRRGPAADASGARPGRSRPGDGARCAGRGRLRDRPSVGDLRLHDQGLAPAHRGPSGQPLGAAGLRTVARPGR